MNKARLDVMGQTIWQGMDDAGLSTRADVSLGNLDQYGQAKFDEKQNKLVAGENITIDEETNTISATGGGSGGRNVGDIFYTARTDEALAGAVECNGGIYSTADYTGSGSIGELLAGGKLDYISLTDYATAISTKGWCDKIGWDGTGTTSFRVPTLTPHIIQTNNISVVGNGMTLGVTNGTLNGGLQTWNGIALTAYTANYGTSVNTQKNSGGNIINDAQYRSIGLATDGTKSGIIADTSDTAQLRVMFQLFNSTTDEAVATVGTVVADVSELKDHRVVDFQIPTAENGYTWYRKYADGWVEQGGRSSGNTATFPIVMRVNSSGISEYTLAGAIHPGDPRQTYEHFNFTNRTTTGFTFQQYDGYTFSWVCYGMAA